MKVFGENAVGREGWRGVGVGGEAVRLSPKYWEKLNEMVIVWGPRFTVYYSTTKDT